MLLLQKGSTASGDSEWARRRPPVGKRLVNVPFADFKKALDAARLGYSREYRDLDLLEPPGEAQAPALRPSPVLWARCLCRLGGLDQAMGLFLRVEEYGPWAQVWQLRSRIVTAVGARHTVLVAPNIGVHLCVFAGLPRS